MTPGAVNLDEIRKQREEVQARAESLSASLRPGVDFQTPTPGEIMRAVKDGEEGLARLFAAMFTGRLVYDLDAGTWYLLRGGYWYDCPTARPFLDHLTNALEEQRNRLFKEAEARKAAGVIVDADDEEDGAEGGAPPPTKAPKGTRQIQKAILDLLRKTRGQNAILTQAREGIAGAGSWDRLGVTSDAWKPFPLILPFRNGKIVELCRDINDEFTYYTVRDARPDDWIREQDVIPTDWQGIDAPAPTFSKFLSEVFQRPPRDAEGNAYLEGMKDDDYPDALYTQDMTGYLLRVLGYIFSGDPREHVVIYWHGPEARNGKTTLIEHALHPTFGWMVDTFSNSLISDDGRHGRKSESSGMARPDLVRLSKCRLAYMKEEEKGTRLSGAKIASLNGGDVIRARGLYEKDEELYEPPYTMIIGTNNLANSDPDEKALRERMGIIPFLWRFLKPESEDFGKPGTSRADMGLKERLQDDDERAGIAAAVVRGWCDYREREGLAPPRPVLHRQREYWIDQAGEERFLDEFTKVDPNEKTTAKELEEAYRYWCAEQGHRPNPARLRKITNKAHNGIHKSVRHGKGTVYPQLKLVWESGKLDYGQG